MVNKKKFVLDTNVLLYDIESIYSFDDNDVIIPIVVLEELDKFKNGNDIINFHAREFTRKLDELSKVNKFQNGISLGEGKGKLYIETGKPFSEEMLLSFPEKSPDHRILAIAHYLFKSTDIKVILITKDINLRMKAKSLGMDSEDYETGKIENIEESIDNKIKTIDYFSDNIIQQIYDSQLNGVAVNTITDKFDKESGNEYFIAKTDSSSMLGYFDAEKELLKSVSKFKAFSIEPRNAEQTFAMHALTNPDISLVALTGPAGTGKTLLALATALHQHRNFETIMLSRPIVALANRDLGFLPGDVKDKIDPYMQPLYDNLGVIKYNLKNTSNEYKTIEDLQRNGKLQINPLAFIRGRSLAKSFFIVDEAQNLTPHEIKTIITRAAEGTKIIFTGDIFQIDSPYLDKKSNGLSFLTDRMKGQEIFAHVNLVKGERSYLAELASKLLQ